MVIAKHRDLISYYHGFPTINDPKRKDFMDM